MKHSVSADANNKANGKAVHVSPRSALARTSLCEPPVPVLALRDWPASSTASGHSRSASAGSTNRPGD